LSVSENRVSENPPGKARRRITDVVNRSEAEIDTPEECPQGKAKPPSNGHGRRRRDSPPALKMTRRRRLDLRPKHFENREIFPIFKTLRSSATVATKMTKPNRSYNLSGTLVTSGAALGAVYLRLRLRFPVLALGILTHAQGL